MEDGETKDQLNRFMDNMNSAIEGGADFVLEQAPLVVQEIVVWGRVEHTTWVVLSVAMMTTAILVFKKKGLPYCATLDNSTGNRDIATAFSWLAFVIVTVISSTVFAVNLTHCLKAWFAPRLYVIEYIADALK